MKYNIITDLSATTYKNYGDKLQNNDESNSEFDYKKCLFFETAQVLDANKNPPHDISAMKYIYSRKYRPYELFEYPHDILNFHGKLGGGRIHVKNNNIYFNDAVIDYISTNIINTNEIFADSGNITSVSVTSITATSPTCGVSSDHGYIDNISGNTLHYDNGKFTNITVTGKADLVAAEAKWADIAELYHGDKEYEPGTLVKFDGINELTLATDYANGCISEKPAILMNTKIRQVVNSVPLLLTGKTKVKVTEPIKKFDKIELSDIPGIARKHTNRQILGIALESNDNVNIKLVECIIKLMI